MQESGRETKKQRNSELTFRTPHAEDPGETQNRRKTNRDLDSVKAKQFEEEVRFQTKRGNKCQLRLKSGTQFPKWAWAWAWASNGENTIIMIIIIFYFFHSEIINKLIAHLIVLYHSRCLKMRFTTFVNSKENTAT